MISKGHQRLENSEEHWAQASLPSHVSAVSFFLSRGAEVHLNMGLFPNLKTITSSKNVKVTPHHTD